jgi:hypothetical protein
MVLLVEVDGWKKIRPRVTEPHSCRPVADGLPYTREMTRRRAVMRLASAIWAKVLWLKADVAPLEMRDFFGQPLLVIGKNRVFGQAARAKPPKKQA